MAHFGWRRLFLAVCGAIASSCVSTTDYLGYSLKEKPPVQETRPQTVLGALKCVDSYPNPYLEIGHRHEDIKAKLDNAYRQLMEGPADTSTIYYEVAGTQQSVVRDILHNNEVRSEGVGIGMLVAAMHDDRDKFDRLWRYARDNLQVTSGPLKGTFRSRCDASPDPGESTKECLDPYGLQQFVMALLLARQRWIPSANMVDYGTEVSRLFDAMLNKPAVANDPSAGAGTGGKASVGGAATAGGASSVASNTTSTVTTTPTSGGSASAGSGNVPSASAGASNAPSVAGAPNTAALGGSSSGSEASGGSVIVATGGTSAAYGGKGSRGIFDGRTKLIFDDPVTGAAIASTSSIMPGFYSVWAQVTGEEFFDQAASSARVFLKRVANPATGLPPVRANFDGVAAPGWKDFAPEAYRVLLNLAIDRIWGSGEKWQDAQVNALLSFLLGQGIDSYGSSFSLDGKTVISGDHVPELVMAVGAVASISTHPQRKEFIEAAWNVPVPTGNTRYYHGIIYLVSNLILSGQFRLCPG
jgi:endo-1,4-beta-D-glucanase Y